MKKPPTAREQARRHRVALKRIRGDVRFISWVFETAAALRVPRSAVTANVILHHRVLVSMRSFYDRNLERVFNRESVLVRMLPR